MKQLKYILIAIGAWMLSTSFAIGQLKIDTSTVIREYPFDSSILTKGWCESTTIQGEWTDIDEQYVLTIGNEKHQWFYDEIKEPEITSIYACMNCCSVPDYNITQKRVCDLCGWIQIKIDRVVHEWVTPPPPPKSRFEQIIDSLKSKK